MNEAKDSILRVANVREHARRAGFREAARGHRWYCAVHRDKSPSCTIKDGKIHCWVCSKIWDSVELEMLASGISFRKAIKALSAEYGIKNELTPMLRAAARADWDKYSKESEFWRQGAILKLERVLDYGKKRLFLDSGAVNEKSGTMVKNATSRLQTLKTIGKHESLAEYKHELERDKYEAGRQARAGEAFLRECERYCKKIVKVMGAAG